MINIDDIKIGLLSKEEALGDEHGNGQLEVLKNDGLFINPTDYVKASGASESYLVRDVSHKALDSKYYGIGDLGLITDNRPTYLKKMYICPVLEMPELFDALYPYRYEIRKGVEAVKFGFFPQSACSIEEQQEIEEAYKEKRLKEISVRNSANAKMINRLAYFYSEYTYQGETLILVPVKASGYLNNEFYYKNEHVWIKVEPIVWLLDKKTKKLIAEQGLIPLTDIKLAWLYSWPSLIKAASIFLNEAFLPEILKNVDLGKYSFKNKKEGQELSENDKKIMDLLAAINEYKKYSRVDILKEVDRLIEEHNRKIVELCDSNKSGLTLEYKNEELLYEELVQKLESILVELKLCGAKVQPYYRMVTILEECLDFDDNGDDLVQMISTIKNKIIPSFLKDKTRESLFLDLCIIINAAIGRCKEEIKEFKKTGEIEIKSLDELKLEFRKNLHPFLIKINSMVQTQDIMNEIIECTKEIAENEYSKEKSRRLECLMSALKEMTMVIDEKGNEEDKKRLKMILSHNIDCNYNLLGVLKEFNQMFIEIYQLELEVQRKYEQASKRKKLIVHVNSQSIND